jgi:transcriptional regulator with XRE-family HTH domain
MATTGKRTPAERLRERRDLAKLTQEQAAAGVGITKQYLSNLELGRNTPPGWPLMARLAQFYHCSTDYLLGVTDDPMAESSAPMAGDVLALLERITVLPGAAQTMAVEVLEVMARHEAARREERVGDWDALIRLLERSSSDASVVARRLLDGGSVTMAELLRLAQSVSEHELDNGA